MGKTPLIVDIETDGQPAQVGQLLAVGFQLADQAVAYVRTADQAVEDHGVLEMLADPDRPVVSMTKYDPRYLRLQGWEVEGPFYDLQVMAWVLNENQMLSLDALAKRYLGLTMDKRIKRRDGKPWFLCDSGQLVPLAEAPTDQLVAYCGRDVEAETRLFNHLRQALVDTSWWDYYLEQEVPFTETLLDMECSGLPVNLDDSESLRARLEVEAAAARENLLGSASLPPGFNVGSGDQLASYLYSKVFELTATLDLGEWAVGALKACLAGEHDDCYLDDGDELAEVTIPLFKAGCHVVDFLPVGFSIDTVGRTQVHGRYTLKGRDLAPTEKTASGDRWSTSSPVLKSNLPAMLDPWVVDLLAWRKVDKVLTTYLRPFPHLAQEGRLFGRFNQTGTKTGRLSSSEPNLQNIPSHGPLGEAVRGLFQGDLIVGDYSQLEPRLMAHFSEDPLLLEVYRTGADIYQVTAEAIFGHGVEKDSVERGIAKTLVLAMGYGAGPHKVAQILTVNGYPTNEPTAKGYLGELTSLYNTFFAWREAVMARVKVKGYVTTLGGRHRRLKAAFADRKNWKNIGYGERQAVNAVVQGSAGDIVRKAMEAWPWYLDRRHSGGLRLLAQVHDELVWEYDEVGACGICCNGDPVEPGAHLLDGLKSAAENAHRYDLQVPLVFEPHFGSSWFAAKEGLELPADMNEESSAYQEEES